MSVRVRGAGAASQKEESQEISPFVLLNVFKCFSLPACAVMLLDLFGKLNIVYLAVMELVLTWPGVQPR